MLGGSGAAVHAADAGTGGAGSGGWYSGDS